MMVHIMKGKIAFVTILSVFVMTQSQMIHDHDAMFMTLPCNNNITSCEKWTDSNYDHDETIVIPCGKCISMDLTGDVTLVGGLNIEGKLHFDAGTNIKISTPSIIIQGELSIDPPDSQVPSQQGHGVEFLLTGTDEIHFNAHEHNGATECGGTGCSIGKKPVAVAGGKLNVRGLPESCPAWTRLQSVEREVAPTPNTVPTAPQAKVGCSSTLVNQDFSSNLGSLGSWDGFLAGTAQVQTESDGNSYYHVGGRTSSYNGPRVSLDIACMSANAPYLLSFKYRVSPTDGTATRAETTGGSYIPWVKMIRKDAIFGNIDWLNAPLVFTRGGMGHLPDNEWHEMQYVLEFSNEQTDISKTAELYLYLQMLDIDADVDIDDFLLELAPATVFPSPQNTCQNLIKNGNAMEANGHAFPFYPMSDGMIFTMNDSDSPDGTPYFRINLRVGEYSKPFAQELHTACLTPGSVYEFSASVRIHSPYERSADISVWTEDEQGNKHFYSIVNCPPSSGDWITCTSLYTFNKNIHANSVKAWFVTKIANDTSSTVDWADISFVYRPDLSAAKTLVLEDATGVSDCWAPGAEILITSHTLQWDDSQVAIVEAVDADGKLTLVESIASPITIEDDPMAAVEVALLSRNVRFRAEQDDIANPLHGGHLIVLHTPMEQQFFMGAEINGFGQQGNLGRYPIHFHMCNKVSGSVVKRNVIRNSNQRCIVVHNTDEVQIVENVAFDTAGHCFILEDGGETHNIFERNLGANTVAVQTLISSDESDNVPSTFWVTNPINTWIGNVAAGSVGPGFWLEVKGSVRGPSAAFHPGVNPSKLPLKLFRDNVSHSNSRFGLQTYPQTGYKPVQPAVFQNHRSYRNRQGGIFFHAGGRLEIDGGYFADNQIGVKIDADHSDAIRNSVFIGVSPAYQRVVKALGNAATTYPSRTLCSSLNSVIGIRLDAYHWGGSTATGTQAKNITFSGYGSTGCDHSFALDADSHGRGFFDPRNSLEDITIQDDSNRVNFCEAKESGMVQVAIRDKDGSFMGTPGFIVSNEDAMTIDSQCLSIPETCAAFCPNVCLRALKIAIPSYFWNNPDIELEIDGTAEDQSFSKIIVKNRQEEPKDVTDWDTDTSLFAYLPAGRKYNARFTSRNSIIWPIYARVNYEDAPGECGPDFLNFVFEKPSATSTCHELIVNGNAGDSSDGGSTQGWWHVDGSVEIASGGADGSAHSLLNKNGGGRWYGLAQHLDTRCMTEGQKFAFSAKVKLVKDGALFTCIVQSGDEDLRCPSATIRYRPNYQEVSTGTEWNIIGEMVETSNEWNAMSGEFTISAANAEAGQVSLYINGGPKGVDILLDSVSIVPMSEEPSKSPTEVPTNSPSLPPSTNPSNYPSSTPTFVPTPLIVPAFYNNNADFPLSAVSFGSGGEVDFESSTGQEATIITKDAHSGAGNDNVIDLTVQLLSRELVPSGYQPNLVLFFAPGDVTIDDVTTNDNGFAFFESMVISWFKEKIYDAMEHTWFSFNTRIPNTEPPELGSQQKSTSWKLMDGGSLRLRRENGYVSAFHSEDGVTFTQMGDSMELPDAFKTAPLKIGMRIKREWKSAYNMSLLPTIVSGGPTTVTSQEEPFRSSSFTDAVADSTTPVFFEESGVTFASSTGQEAVMLTKMAYEGEGESSMIDLTVHYRVREIFGTSYQAGIALFFAREDAEIDHISMSDNNYGSFEQVVVATVRDKIHATIDHTWFYKHATLPEGTGTGYQSGGDSYRMVSGALRLQRTGGYISTYYSKNDGALWKEIGTPMELPEEFKRIPLKIGIRTKREYTSSYYIHFTPVITSGGAVSLPTENPSSQPTFSPTLPLMPSFNSESASFTPTASFGSGGEVDFESSTGQEATIITKDAHSGAGNDNVIDLTVQLLSRELVPSGYQPNLVLFFAPGDVTIDDVTTNDNGFAFFESMVISWFKEKIYDAMEHTWFSFNTRIPNTEPPELGSQQKSTSWKLMDGGSLRLRRENGYVSAFHSEDGVTFTQMGDSMELPDAFKTAPLKIGMRIKREWKSAYNMSLLPTIVSGGPTTVDSDENPESGVYGFEATNADIYNVALSSDPTNGVQIENGHLLFSSSYGQEETIMTKNAHNGEGDSATIDITVEYISRTMFGTAYEAALALFFATADSTALDLTTNDNNYSQFESNVVATVRDKIHATMDHVWFSKHTQSADGTGTVYEPGSDNYKMVSGFLRLRRQDGFISAFHSMNGELWKEIGAPVELPEDLKRIPLKIGMRIKREYKASYHIEVRPSITCGGEVHEHH